MPFINGRFYINPAHGRALEAARAAEGMQHAASNAGKGVKEREVKPQPQIDYPVSEDERRLTVVIFNETGGLSPARRVGNGSAADLHEARIAVGEVSDRAIRTGHSRAVAPQEIETGLWEGLNDRNRASIRAWNDSLTAARAVLDGSNATNNATHFRLDAEDGKVPSWARGKEPSSSYGPFRNSGGGDASVPTTSIHVYP